MEVQQQQERRWQNVLGQAFLAASASILFVTTKSTWAIAGVDFFVILGGLSFLFSLLLIISALGVVIEKLDKLLTWMENTAGWLWFTFAIINIVIIISGWVEQRSKIDESSWLYNPYFWSVPIWLVVYTIILFIVGFSPIYFHIKEHGPKKTTRRYSLILALALTVVAFVGLLTEVYSITWVLVFQGLGILSILARISVKDEKA